MRWRRQPPVKLTPAMPWWSAVIGCSEKLSKIYMDERVASDPTLVRDRALFIEGLFHIPHRTRTSDLENPPTTCHHLPHTGAEDRSHDRDCQGRLISASPSSVLAQPLHALNATCGWTAPFLLERRQSGKTPKCEVDKTSHSCFPRTHSDGKSSVCRHGPWFVADVFM